MKRTNVIAVFVGFAVVLATSQDAFARNRMYNPSLGRWMQRDPAGTTQAPAMARNVSSLRFTQPDSAGQYLDGMNLNQFVRSNPIKYRDWTGLEAGPTQPSTCYCGPDVTGFLVDLVNYTNKWRVKQGAISRYDGYVWLDENGINLDWLSTVGPYKTRNCPSGRQCQNTYWLCDECVHDHWIGNFMFGYLGRMFRLPDWLMDAAGNAVQAGGEDPSWDTAGYGLGRIMHDELTNPKGKDYICQILKSDMNLWNAANNTEAKPPTSSVSPGFPAPGVPVTPKWPTPHAIGYKDCKKCPEDLPATVRNTVPGGKFGSSFPDVKK